MNGSDMDTGCFSKRLGKLAEREHLSQSELARRVGTSHSLVWKWLTGRATPTMKFLPRIAEVLNTDMDTLLGKGPVDVANLSEDLALLEQLCEKVKMMPLEMKRIVAAFVCQVEAAGSGGQNGGQRPPTAPRKSARAKG